MKSVAIKGVKQFEVIEMDEPKAKKGDVSIDITRCGICGSDIHYWDLGGPVGLVMGHEFCGVVTNPGARKDLNVGDRVTALPISPCGKCEACLTGNPQYCRDTWSDAIGLSLTRNGGYAPKIVARPDMVIKVPRNVKDNEVAMVEPLAVSLHAIHLADVQVGDTVLVIGAGIIGLAAAMFAKKAGAKYVAVSEANVARGKKAVTLGVADEFLKATDKDFTINAISKSNGGFDKVIECCGNSAAVSSAITVTKPGSTVVLVGVSMAAISIPSIVAVMSEITIKGAIAYTKPEFESVIEMISKKQINALQFVDAVVTQNGVQKAFERLTSGKDDAVKILINPNK